MVLVKMSLSIILATKRFEKCTAGPCLILLFPRAIRFLLAEIQETLNKLHENNQHVLNFTTEIGVVHKAIMHKAIRHLLSNNAQSTNLMEVFYENSVRSIHQLLWNKLHRSSLTLLSGRHHNVS